jgi:arylsulfatase A-like enzyme
MTDDPGFANPATFGGPIRTPTLDRLAASGISYNAFHTTAQCSPTRAAMLTGRNHHHGWTWAGSTPFQSTKLMAVDAAIRFALGLEEKR